MAARKSPKDPGVDKDVEARRARERESRKRESSASRRREETAQLSSSVSAFNSALSTIEGATRSLARGSKALASAARQASSPSLVQYGVAGRLRPAVLQRAVASVHRDLQAKIRYVRLHGVTVPDGREKPYEDLLAGLAAVSDAFGKVLSDFEKAMPERSEDGPKQVRELVIAAAKASVFLNRLTRRGKASSSVHSAAVASEIAGGDVSFY